MSLPAPPDGSAPGYYGVYPAIVTNIVDDQNLGRIQVRLPWLGSDGDRDVRAWATLCTPYADDDQGLEILPEVGTQVVLAFEAGNLRRPYIMGATWNGRESLPSSPDAANNIRVLRTRSGSRLEFDDTAGAAKVTVSTSSGHTLVLDDGAQEVTLQHANGCVLRMDISGSVHIEANLEVEVTAPMVQVNAPISTFSGIVQAQTFIAESGVVSPAYTPGVGNIW